jgi:hypothetical protein
MPTLLEALFPVTQDRRTSIEDECDDDMLDLIGRQDA